MKVTLHGLKGVSATLGAKTLHYLTCALENTSPSDQIALVPSLIDSLELALAQLCRPFPKS
jgi:HPt (histidine-containing phosphotransfer) domain-containing protein